MILNAQDYRRRAEAIARFASKAHLPQTRIELEALAANWRALAARAESRSVPSVEPAQSEPEISDAAG